jgi:hypothetical protein
VGTVEEVGAAGVAYISRARFEQLLGSGRLMRLSGDGDPAEMVRALERVLVAQAVPVRLLLPLSELEAAVDGHIALLITALQRRRMQALAPAKRPEPPPPKPPELPRIVRVLELARRWQGILDRGQARTRDDLAKLTGLDSRYVGNILELLRLPEHPRGHRAPARRRRQRGHGALAAAHRSAAA